MTETFAGTWAMVRLGVRRDRWLLPLWIIGFAITAGATASATSGLYPDLASRLAAATTINETASLVALFGRIYDPSSLGAISMIKYTAFMAALLAVVMVFVTIRHTRADEESGRLELVSGGRLGRNAPLAAALAIGFGASVLVGASTSVALAAGGLPVTGSVAFGLGWAATGMVFTAVAAVTAQVTTTARAAIGLGVVVIAITYALRAVGDLAEPGPSALSWLSPIGWNQQVRAFAGDRWWVLGLPLALCVALVPAAFWLRASRDLGTGLFVERRGPGRGELGSAWDLAVRMHGRVLVAWVAGFVVFGAVIGSLAGDVEGMLRSPNAQELIKKLGGTGALTDAFLSAEMAVMGVIAAAYGLSVAAHLRREEVEGHTEVLLAGALTRLRWASSHLAVALAGVAILDAVAGLAIGSAAALALHDASQLGRVALVALAQVPAGWVLAGIVVALFGWVPRVTTAAWGLLAVYVALGEFGALWNAPQWLMDLSPFGHSPVLPIHIDAAVPLVALVSVAAVLAGAGLVGWRRRDLTP